jgi:GNAT superfamily N-acetyltransferase
MLADGYTDLPPEKIAAVVTYLEMRRPPPSRAAPARWSLAPIGADLPRYRSLYRRVGERWLWFSRLVMDDGELRAILADPAVEAFALLDGSAEIGLLELDFRERGACELAFFGLIPEAIGTGAGRFLMDAATARAFAKPIERFWVHTCTLDHPSAVEFYVRSGFTPYKRAIEVADDPRLMERLPRDAAPHAPVIVAQTGRAQDGSSWKGQAER